jgi:HlyD family secretion protein
MLELLAAAPRDRRRRRRWAALAGAVAILALGLVFLAPGSRSAGTRFRTEPAALGDLRVTVSASGTLQPTQSVDVGSEVSGTLASVQVQENDRVRQGQVLARLDTTKLENAVAKSRASLDAAEAAVAQARATAAQAQATLGRMRQVAALSGGRVPAKTDLETQEAALLQAQAAEASARAVVAQARATLQGDQTDLAKATIRSPVDGVVLSRKVEPGQSVAAAMTVPVLFSLARDLARMELQIKVDEADVGSVRLGQPATFTVSAYPGRRFPATILRVGLGATTTDNVVTYKTVLRVANEDLALRPGMTATATLTVAERQGVLTVPNAALRFTPPRTPGAEAGGLVARLLPHPPRSPEGGGGAQAKDADRQVWVPGPDGPRPVPVRTGVSDGRATEITGGDLRPGQAVITDCQEAKP